jgi:pimeloyl-ACP methyl ester carboxylesterase
MEVFREELENIRGDLDEGQPSATQPQTQEYHVTLVGHSMGTMVLNEWLRRDQIEQRKKGYANIVYMAAACTVRDFSRAVVPYLIEHSKTPFYNLMLHPLADLRERGRGWDLPPRGSLLVWLDDFLTSPATPLDRTMGRWDNVISAVEVIPQSIRGQITLKSFSLAPYNQAPPPAGQPDYGPQEHGQFRGRPYWCQEFWEQQSPVVDTKCETAGN